jgi:hypothetical protein
MCNLAMFLQEQGKIMSGVEGFMYPNEVGL